MDKVQLSAQSRGAARAKWWPGRHMVDELPQTDAAAGTGPLFGTPTIVRPGDGIWPQAVSFPPAKPPVVPVCTASQQVHLCQDQDMVNDDPWVALRPRWAAMLCAISASQALSRSHKSTCITRCAVDCSEHRGCPSQGCRQGASLAICKRHAKL